MFPTADYFLLGKICRYVILIHMDNPMLLKLHSLFLPAHICKGLQLGT